MLDVHRVIAIGASAGGLEALQGLVRGLPEDLPAAVLVVFHITPTAKSTLPNILRQWSRLSIAHASDGDRLERSHIYVAPPDHHMVVSAGTIRLTKGPRENHQRPAVDPLFRSVARNYGRRAIGVILSGTLDDGTAGLTAIHMAGGITVVQSPEDALYAGMPDSALENVAVDHVVTAAAMGKVLDRIVREPPRAVPEGLPPIPDEDRIPAFDAGATHETSTNGTPSNFSCPDCGGTLFEVQEGDLQRFRCRVGHAYSVDALGGAKSEKVEEALWVALRALEEHADILRRAGARARVHGFGRAAVDLDRAAEDDQGRAELIRQILETNGVKSIVLGGLEREGKEGKAVTGAASRGIR